MSNSIIYLVVREPLHDVSNAQPASFLSCQIRVRSVLDLATH